MRPRTLRTVASEWTRIGLIGFGGPSAHIALIRELVLERRGWLSARKLEDGIAACSLLPGPASTQLAIFCAWRVGGPLGAIVGGLGFVVPAVVLILALSALFLVGTPPDWIRGAGAGAGAAVAAVAVKAGASLLGPSLERAGVGVAAGARSSIYIVLGAAAAAFVGVYLVVALIGCGLLELGIRTGRSERLDVHAGWVAGALLATVSVGGIGALAWVAFKVGALSYGGGFVIVPLMQRDAVHTYHWISSTRFLDAVALGQITPGPVLATVAAVGFTAHGLAGGALAAAVAFSPSFALVLLGGRHFARLRSDARAGSFLDGAGPAAVKAILGAAIPLAGALHERWQLAILAGSALALLVARRGVVQTLVAAGALGAVAGLAGARLP